MSQVKIFWDPSGFELDALGTKKYVGATDGDTPSITLSIRMLSIDTPEVHYPGTAKPSKHDAKLQQLAEWISAGKAPLRDSLAAYLHPRLATGSAGTLHEQQGEHASEHFKQLLKDKLSRPGKPDRTLFLRAANQPFDQNGRLLAYIAPNYTQTERETMSRKERATFNLLMVESGWAASFIIYPSLPSHPDLVLMHSAAKRAQENGLGAWADPHMLTGYEFRMCYKLYEVTDQLVKGKKLTSAQRGAWIERYCADMASREIYYPQDYFRVQPFNRIFIWPADVTEAVARLNLQPGE